VFSSLSPSGLQAEIQSPVNEWELYDLKNDPHEQKNLIRLAAYLPTFTIMKKELIKQRKLYDDHEPAGELK
jgi:hypothetical protein